MLYGWSVGQLRTHVQKLHEAAMRKLRCMCGHIRSEKIRNEVIWEKVGEASEVEKMRKARLRWFGHVKQRCEDASMRRC